MLLPSYQKKLLEAGCDEAGRGCLAGPVVAAAVILPKDYKNPLLNDSKQLSEKTREKLRPIIERDALTWAVGLCTPEEIDKINILNASFLAMHRALNKLTILPELILVDGNRFKPYQKVRHACIIKGDEQYMSIAAASILAKTHRDTLMRVLHITHPHYYWNQNKGYPTAQHRESISYYGATSQHRMSFTLLPQQLELEF